MRTPSIVLTCILTSSAAAQVSTDYLVLAAVAASDPYDAAVRVLAEHHRARVVRFAPGALEPVREALVAAAPRHVALVMRPEQIDFGFQRRFLQLATGIDADPFVDFEFGYITGRTAGDAVDLCRRGVARRPKAGDLAVASVAGGVEHSVVTSRPESLRRDLLDAVQLYCAGKEAFPVDGRDRAFLEKELPRLRGRDAVTFIGHGYPREVVGGPTFAELDGLRLDGAVVLNVACYTGVTRTFFEDDHRAGVLRQLEVPFDESFCLAILRSGVVGYTAYLCPRPAGPELSTDLAALLADGLSLGAARRRDYDKTVLGFLGFGEERMVLGPVADGTELRAGRDPVRDMMLEGATGGVLFGDPACVPFAARDAEAPVQIEMEAAEGGFRIRARATTRALYQHCADPTAKWGKTMAMKVHARVPLGDSLVEDVVVDSVRVGREVLPSRALWAIEDDRGARFLQLKINFPRRDRWAGELVVAARVLATRDPDRARSRGGEVQRAPVVSQDLRSREVQDFMLERAAARDVSRPALQAALDASAAEVGVAGVEAGALDRLAAFGSEGFRATCVLLEVGHAHYRTWKLLEATWTPGDEQQLVALATFEDLPNFASWQVLEGLGVADTPAVRAYLTERLSTEQDPGLFMATAKGLAHLGAREAAAAIGDRVLLFLDGWSGVERHLVEALAELGGPVAVERLERIARDPRSSSVESALRALDGLDPEAATRARAARR